MVQIDVKFGMFLTLKQPTFVMTPKSLKDPNEAVHRRQSHQIHRQVRLHQIRRRNKIKTMTQSLTLEYHQTSTPIQTHRFTASELSLSQLWIFQNHRLNGGKI